MDRTAADVQARLATTQGFGELVNALRGMAAARSERARARIAGADAYSRTVAAAIGQALDEGWKAVRGPVAAQYARNRFSVTGQVSHLLAEVDRLTAIAPA